MNAPQPILLFSEGISMAHVLRPLLIARWLRTLGLPIVVACPATRQEFFVAEGFSTTIITIPNATALYARLQQPGQAMYTVAELHAEALEDEALLDKLDPCLVLADFRFTALLAAYKRGIPTVNISSVSCHPAFDTIRSGWPEPYLPTWMPETLGSKLYDRFLGAMIAQASLPRLASSLQELARQQGYPVLATFFEYASFGDLCLLCDHPAVMPLKQLRSQDVYTGALVWNRGDSLPARLADFDQHVPTIYITPGTQDALPVTMLEPYVKQLLAHGFQVILSKGQRAFELAFDHPQLVVVDFINNCADLLQHVDLFVHHGGQMSMYLGMTHGVPMLALPPIAECFFHAKAIEEQGVGQLLRPSRLTQAALMANTLDILTTTDYQLNATRLQQQIHSFDNRELVCTRIVQLLDQQPQVQERAVAAYAS